jgi:nucleoside-diphosphate-sugar epimerase
MSKKLSANKTVLVTGGAGFIGSHLVDALLTKGARVKVVDDLSRGKLQNLKHCIKKIEFLEGDLANPEIARNALEGCDICYHLAAVVGDVRWMNTHPSEIFKSLLINYQVIDTCRKMDIEKLLYVSSACAYPVGLQANADLPPLKEDDVLESGAMPDGDYGWAKLMGEIQCKAYHETYGLKMAIVRPFNPYGPRESFTVQDSHVIPALIRRAVNRENPFIVWGDGEQRRAFTYVTDLVDGIILAGENLSDASPVNLGELKDTSVRELAELVLKFTGYTTQIVWDTSKPTGVSVRKSDMTKASQVLKWTPRVALEEGIRRTIDWYLTNKATI